MTPLIKSLIRAYVYFEICNLSLTAIAKGDGFLLSIVSTISLWVLVYAFPIFPYDTVKTEDE
jgi:hypothetical protein